MSDVRTPVVFIHGLWLHTSAWQPWVDLFSQKGFAPVAPGWPNEPDTVAAARANAEVVAGFGIDEVTAHFAEIVAAQPQPPVIVGHSFGGLIAQKLAGLGYGRATVAISPTQIKGVKPLPFAQLRSGFPALGKPGNKKGAVALTAKQFRYALGNAIDEAQSDRLFNAYAIPSPGRPIFEAAFANFHKNSPAAVNTSSESRGPLLLISGQKDHTVPDVVTRASFKRYGNSTAVTDLKQFADRGHSLVIDDGWRVIADYVLGWLAAQRIRAVNDSTGAMR